MPKLLRGRPPWDAVEEHQVRKLAGSRHAPGDWIQRARMSVRSWAGLRSGAIAAELRCHPQTVREWVARFNAEGRCGFGALDGDVGQRLHIRVGHDRAVAVHEHLFGQAHEKD